MDNEPLDVLLAVRASRKGGILYSMYDMQFAISNKKISRDIDLRKIIIGLRFEKGSMVHVTIVHCHYLTSSCYMLLAKNQPPCVPRVIMVKLSNY